MLYTITIPGAAREDSVIINRKGARFAVVDSSHAVKTDGVYFLFHSATLTIKDGSEYCVFNHPWEVKDFLNSRSMEMQEKALRSPVSCVVSSHVHSSVPGVVLDRED